MQKYISLEESITKNFFKNNLMTSRLFEKLEMTEIFLFSKIKFSNFTEK